MDRFRVGPIPKVVEESQMDGLGGAVRVLQAGGMFLPKTVVMHAGCSGLCLPGPVYVVR